MNRKLSIVGLAGATGAFGALAWWWYVSKCGKDTPRIPQNVDNDTSLPDHGSTIDAPSPPSSDAILSNASRPPLDLSACTAILFVGVKGSGRSRAIRTIRPWLARFNFPSRHLTIANVIGEGYVHGAFSDADWANAVSKYDAALSKDELAYVKAVLRAVQERDTHPTVMLVSNITSVAEIDHLASVLKDVVVVRMVSPDAPVADQASVSKLSSLSPDLEFVTDDCHSSDAYNTRLARAFTGHILPRLHSKLTISEIADRLAAHTVPIPNTLGAKFYDTAAMWVYPQVLHSLMFISAAQLTLKHWEFDAITAVSPNAIPLATLLAHMLRKRHLLLLHHTKTHPTHTETEWQTGTSALGSFAIGWPKSLYHKDFKRVLLVDDILATGCRAQAAASLARRVGATPIGMCVLLEVPVTRAELGVPLHVLMADL